MGMLTFSPGRSALSPQPFQRRTTSQIGTEDSGLAAARGWGFSRSRDTEFHRMGDSPGSCGISSIIRRNRRRGTLPRGFKAAGSRFYFFSGTLLRRYFLWIIRSKGKSADCGVLCNLQGTGARLPENPCACSERSSTGGTPAPASAVMRGKFQNGTPPLKRCFWNRIHIICDFRKFNIM